MANYIHKGALLRTAQLILNGASTRQHLKRVARATLAFSKKRANYEASVHLHFAYYNLCRIHGSLRVTPAMAAGVTDRILEPMDLVLYMETIPAR